MFFFVCVFFFLLFLFFFCVFLLFFLLYFFFVFLCSFPFVGLLSLDFCRWLPSCFVLRFFGTEVDAIKGQAKKTMSAAADFVSGWLFEARVSFDPGLDRMLLGHFWPCNRFAEGD